MARWPASPLATTERYKNKQGERVEDTQWHNVVIWGNLAEIAEKYLQKGKEVALEGKLVHRSYEDKDGNKRYISEIVASDFLMLGKKTTRSELRKPPQRKPSPPTICPSSHPPFIP